MVNTVWTPEMLKQLDTYIWPRVTESAASMVIPHIETDRIVYRFHKSTDTEISEAGIMFDEVGIGSPSQLEWMDFMLTRRESGWTVENLLANLGQPDLIVRGNENKLLRLVEDTERVIFNGEPTIAPAVTAGTIGGVGILNNTTIPAGSPYTVSSAGDFKLLIDGLASAIPPYYKALAGPWKLIMTPGLLQQAKTLTNAFGITDFQLVQNTYMDIKSSTLGEATANKRVSHQFVIDEIANTHYLFSQAEIDAGLDVAGTNEKILLLKPEERYVAVVLNKPVGFFPPLEVGPVTKFWLGWRGAGCVFDPNAVISATVDIS